MTTTGDILRFIHTIAPPYMKEEWDHVGLNCGRLDRQVRHVLVALDPFENVCREAKQIGADLLVTHHALLWDPGFITDETAQGRNALYLIENRIGHNNAHTNLDCAPGGVNDQLAQLLGLHDIRVIQPKGTDDEGREYGLLRMGQLDTMDLTDFLSLVKHRLGCQGLKYVDGGRPVRTVAVGGGSCAGALPDALLAGCDTFVTADVKYNQFFDARDLGINLIDAGHFHTENPVVGYLAAQIGAAFPEIQVTISQKHTDCANFFC